MQHLSLVADVQCLNYVYWKPIVVRFVFELMNESSDLADSDEIYFANCGRCEIDLPCSTVVVAVFVCVCFCAADGKMNDLRFNGSGVTLQ